MSTRWFGLTLLAIVLLVGCSRSPNSTPEGLQGRFQAAQNIQDVAKRDSALATVAEDAGKAGAGEIAVKAIAAISSPDFRDATAARVAESLAKAGKQGDAVEVAKKIDSPNVRNATMEKIASKR